MVSMDSTRLGTRESASDGPSGVAAPTRPGRGRTAPGTRTLFTAVLAAAAFAAACTDGPTGPEAEVPSRSLGPGHFADVSGDRVVWQRRTGGPLLGRDLSTGEERMIAPVPDGGQVDRAAISGQRVAWMLRISAEPKPPPSRIVIGRFSGDDTTVISGPDVRDAFPDVSDRYVVWERRVDGDPDVFAYDMRTGEVMPVARGAAAELQPAVDDGRVVFTHWRVDSTGAARTEIRLHELATGETRTLSPNDGALQGNPDISGDVVVWIDNTDGTSDVVYRDLTTNEFVNVTRDRGNPSFPAISGSLVVWSDARNARPGQTGLDENLDIFAFDIETGEEFAVSTAPGLQDHPAVSGNRVVWGDWSGVPAQVLVAEVDR